MGLITKVISLTREIIFGAKSDTLKINTAGDVTRTADHFSSPGDDSNPLPEDYAICVDYPRTGSLASVGYIDPLNVNESLPGEKKIYSRNSTATIMAYIHLKNDGEIEIKSLGSTTSFKPSGEIEFSNPAGTATFSAAGGFKFQNTLGIMELQASGVVNLNGFTFAPGGGGFGGSISATSVVANGKELAGHTHPVTAAPGTTGPNN